MNQQLTPRVLALLKQLTAYRIVSTDQVAEFLYDPKIRNISEATDSNQIKKKKRIAVSHLLVRLSQRGFLTRNYLYTKQIAGEMNKRPKSVWFVTPKNLKAISKKLSDVRRADLWEEYFEDVNFDRRVSPAFQNNTLAHEVGISQFFLTMNAALNQSKLSVPVWLNTSPSHPLVSTKVDAKITPKDRAKKPYVKKLPINPDGFFMIDDGEEYTFYFLEFDNNTETLTEKLTNKFIAYQSYNQQKLFRDETLPRLVAAYNLEIPTDARIGLRVLFVTTTENRRDDLFIKSTRMPAGNYFLFATIEDCTAGAFAPHWLGKKGFTPYFEKYWDMAEPRDPKKTPKARPSVLREFRNEAIKEMERIAIP